MTKEQLVLAISPHYEELNNRRWLCSSSCFRWKPARMIGQAGLFILLEEVFWFV